MGWQSGYVSVSEIRHAVRPTLTGPRAWCGAGRVGRLHLSRFSSTDGAACPLCAAAVVALIPQPRPAEELISIG